ncbi:hypothetical protein GJ744_002411 [Endocarpon pusillum]|uniref:DNA-directed RNA polymerases I n=2 Tax=Endocarpon pusillum TaxID=364733 RepID=U1HW35_ENDPU|nr:uncharacterized protein EPUS_00852 [Endocarpon pusillum Z07020]ERF73599.1 hypothetical protein EPUS_00852 [Endocarpon pusillum Z07020]KAF7504354.1 hypothetical protein GJ744_002411 [Endocarpon pusillum]
MSDYGGDDDAGLDAGDDFDTYDPEEPPEDFGPDVDETALEEEVAAREAQHGDTQNKTVVTGDASAGQKKPTSENDKKIPDDKRSTTPYMTKYERARVLGTRALQISRNAPTLVDLEGETDPLQIAIKELNQKKMPLIVRRYLPDGWYEDWTCEELL